MERLLLDDLTGAYQRAGLTDILSRLAAEHARTGAHYALAMVDVDHLKTLNDVYGHATGDAALRAVAERAGGVLRSGDKLFRYGGDEFLIVLPGTTHAEAEAVLRRVRDQVIANPVEAAVWVNVNISVGVAASDERGAPGEEDDLFERADARLYVAKRVGRNTVVASDDPLTLQRESVLRETRLVGRDEQLGRVDAFLPAPARTEGERVLQLTGPAGAGLTRFLQEVGVRAAIAGRAVRRIRAVPANHGVYLRAMEQAYGELLPPDATESEVADRLAYDADAHGLLVLLEGGRWLDPGSRALLGARLRQGGAKLVEAVPAGEAAAFSPGTTLTLEPLSDADVGNWLSAALGIALDAAMVRALAHAGGGKPGRVARIVRRLAERGALSSEAQLVSAEPELIAELGRLEDDAPRPLDLPQWDQPLVGRSRWLAGANHAVRSSRLSVLVGPGGSGKSRLAAQLALELAGEAPGGTHWIDLRAVQGAAELPALIAGRLGLEPTDDAAELTSRLRDRPRPPGEAVLLVLDEIDAIAAEVGWLDSLLEAAPWLRLLVTCRMPLRLAGERLIEVPELSATAASELFRRGMARVGAQDDVSDEELLDLIEKVGPSPLAVELAATWTRALSPSELAEELERRPELLTQQPGMQPRTARFIDITRELMSAHEQEALGTLALIPAGFEAEAGRSAAQASPFFLLALLERSLLRREGTRYTVHAAIAERYRAGLRDGAAARRRVALTYANLASRIEEMDGSERSSRGYRQADAERANLFFAFRVAVEERDEELAWPLARLLRGYLDVRGRGREGLELFGHAAAALQDTPFTELRGWVADAIAVFHVNRSEAAEAERSIAAALALLEPHSPGPTAAMAWNTRGIIDFHLNRTEESLAAFHRSAEMRKEVGDAVGEAQARGNVAIVLTSVDRPNEAFAALEGAAENYRRVEHTSGVALSLQQLAHLGRTAKLLTPAEHLAYARSALEMAESIGYASCAHAAAGELGEGLLDAGRAEEACAAFERAREWARVEENAVAEAEFTARLAEARRLADEELRRQVMDARAEPASG